MADFKQLRTDVKDLIDLGAPDEEVDAYIVSRGYTPADFKRANENFGTFTSSVKRGGKGIGSLVADILPAMGGYVGEQIGIPGAKAYKERQMAEAAQTQEEIAKFLPAQYESYEDVKGFRDVPGYITEAVGEAIPSMIPGVVTGGAASVLGRGAVAVAGKVASEQAAKSYLASQAAQNVSKDFAAKRAAEVGAIAATQAMARKQLGQEALGAFTGSAALNIPEAYQSIYSETGQEQLLPALTSGSFNAVLDAITPLSLLRSARGKGLSNNDIVGAWYARGAKELGKGFLTEGATESLQEMTNAAAIKFVDENKDFFTPENLTRFIDAGLKGGIGGGAIQGGFGVAFGKQAPKEAPPVPPTTPPGVSTSQPTLPEGAVQGQQGELFGAAPEGRLPERVEPVFKAGEVEQTETPEGTIIQTGKIQDYKAAAPLPPEVELTGKQASLLPESEQGELDLTASTQPEIKRGELRNIYGQPIDPLRNIEGNIAGPLTGPAKPIGEEIRGVVEAAKQDPSASKLLKANNPATAKLVTTRIEELVEAAGGDSVLAMEQLYENNRKGQGKALTPAQQELLDVAYRRATGRQIEDAIKERAFIGVAQPDLFEGDTTPAAPAPAPVVAANPETAWNEHKNDDHPAYTDLSPEEKAEWGRYVTKGTTGASAFQDVTRAYDERMVRDKKKTTEEVKQIFSEERKKTTKDIENDIAGLDYNGLLNYMLANGPESIQGVMRKVADAVKRMKAKGYTFSFDLSQSPQQSKLLNLSGNARSGAAGHVQPLGKHMQLVISGRNSSRPFGGDFETVAHELLHSVTIPLIRFGEANPNTPEGKIVQELKDLSAHVKKELRKRERMGTATPEELFYLNNTNAFGKRVKGGTIHIADEIMSQGNTGSNFRYILETIPYKGKSALDAFVEMVRKLIGLSPREETALSELIRLSDKLFEGQVPMPTSQYGKKVSSEVSTNKSSEFSMEDLPHRRENQDFVIKAGTNIYHGAHLDRAHGIDESGRILKARPGVKSGGGILTEGNLIWFGDKQLASGHAKSEVDTNAARYDKEAGIKRLPGKVFQTTTDRDYKLISKGRVLSKEEADALNDALGIPDYKPLRAGDTADTAAYRAHTNSSTVPRYDISGTGTMSSPWPIILQTLGDYDGYYDSTGIALAAENAIELSGDNDTMRVSSERSVVDSQIPLDAQYDSQIGDIDTPAPAPGPTVVPAPGQPYTLPNLTKLQPAQTAGQQVKNVTKKVTNAWNDEGFWTRFRIAVVDQGSGLAKTLSSLPEFQNGQLRADMLIRSFNQIINLIKNGIQSGIPIVNADGTVIIRQDANNLARAQILADKLDSNPIVKGSGLSGRGFVAEITRIKRGEEIMAEDARLRAKGALMMAEAKAKMAQARQLRASSAPMNEIIKLINQAKALRREGSKIKDINREKQVTQAHITWADAQINAVPETQEVFDIFRATNVGLIDLWESAGLLTKAEADNYRQKTFYVPLYAAREDLSFDDQESYTGKGTGTKTVRLLDRLEGSDLQRNIWENMDKHYASMTAAAFQNQTRRVAVEQLQAVGAAKISTTDDNPAVNLRYKDPSHPNANQHGVVSVILDNPNDLAAFQMMHYELGPLMKGLSATTQALRATALINPMYWIKQLIRDPIHAAIVARTGIVTPFHSAKEYINILANNSEEALLLARRGVIGQIDSTMDLADFLKQVGTEKLNPTKLDALIRKVMRMHEASDAATRVAIYKKAKAEGLSKGMSEAEATDYGVFKSRESINFAVRGNSKTLNTLRHMIPFFSAAITGLDTLYRAASGYGLNPEEKKAAQQLFIKRAGMMAMLSAAYAMILQDDEDYQKLPDNVKDNNWLLPNPFGGGHSFIKIAIPYEVGFLFKTVPEASIRYMAGTSTGKEVLASYFGGLKRNLPGEGILIPQAAKPALEAITNYSFFTGRGIEGMSDQGLPTSQRGPNASEVAKTLSKAGLDKIGISPAKFDHLMQGYFAELGTFSTGMAGAAIAAATGKEPPAKNIEQMPFFKAFMTNPNTSKAATDFYEIMGTAQEVVNAVNRMKKEGRIQEAKEFLSDEDNRKLMAVAPAMRKVQDNMAKIRARVNQIEASKGMDPETKRVQINKLMEMYDRTSRQGYAITEKAGISR